ncbi:lysophospholipid acyltransferase family protein [Geminicoccus roseus]|uniref:lysophospholipid acyltransferase family protein n=1 Tax=Geminicoccus roseus TaxID=404900 RepID=UPI000415C2D8|nr:lysophospholipid acyltransferase family protein [Geminicoccus roseus]
MAALAPALRFVLRALCFVLVLLLGLSIYLAAMPFGRRATWIGRFVWCRGCLLLLNIRVQRHGQAFTACPTLFVANHVSWLDILVLGQAVDGTFVAKSEVAGWPVFGWLAQLAGTMFIRRHWRFAREQRDELAQRLRRGEDIILFPEGTSTDGLDVLAFKSTLFAAAEPKLLDRPVAVQPVTIAYVALADGMPIGPDQADRYAWYGDALFGTHLFGALCDRGCRIELVFHEPVLSWEVPDRKVMARQMQAVIRADLAMRVGQAVPAAPDEVEAVLGRIPAAPAAGFAAAVAEPADQFS